MISRDGFVGAGTVTIDVDAAPPKEVKQKPNQAAMPIAPAGTAAFYVTCPPGISPGTMVAFAAFGSMVLVTVPAGVVPGSYFMTYLPVPSEGVPPPPAPDNWYYVDPNGRTQGPHTTSEMQGWREFFSDDTLVMVPGSSEWAPLHVHADLLSPAC